MVEWSIAAVLKTVEVRSFRGFESLSPRQNTRIEYFSILVFYLPNKERDSWVGAVLREQNALPYKSWITSKMTAKDAIDNGGAGRAAKGESPVRIDLNPSGSHEEKTSFSTTLSECPLGVSEIPVRVTRNWHLCKKLVHKCLFSCVYVRTVDVGC